MKYLSQKSFLDPPFHQPGKVSVILHIQMSSDYRGAAWWEKTFNRLLRKKLHGDVFVTLTQKEYFCGTAELVLLNTLSVKENQPCASQKRLRAFRAAKLIKREAAYHSKSQTWEVLLSFINKLHLCSLPSLVLTFQGNRQSLHQFLKVEQLFL